MELIKKIPLLTILIILFIIPFALPVVVNAQQAPTQCNITHSITISGTACPQGSTNIDQNGTCCLINTILNVRDWLFYILLTITAIFIILAGYYFVTASGNPEQVNKARHMILYALIGLLVAFAALGLVSLVGTIAGFKL